MNEFSRISVIAAAALIGTAVFLMVDGQILGEMTTNLSTVLLITAIPVITKSRNSEALIDAHRTSE